MGFLDMEKETIQIDFRNILGIILNNWIIILTVTIIFAAISLMFTKLCIPKKYTSSVSLYVMNNKSTQNTGEILSSDISASQMLVNTYAVILSDNFVMEDISKSLIQKYGVEKLSTAFPVVEGADGPSIPSGAIAGCISMGAVNETEVLQITATTKDPQVSVDVCLAMVEVAPKVLSEVMGVAYVNPIGYPELPKYASSPSVFKNVLVGGFMGFLVSVFIIVAIRILDNTITDAESLRSKFEVPVLGEIPIYDVPEEGDEADVKL